MKTCPKCHGTCYLQDYVEMGKRMARIRKNAKATLKEVARSTGLSIGHINDMEHGRRPWNPESIVKYLDAIS